MTEEEIKSLAVDAWRLMVANEDFIAHIPCSKEKSAKAKSRDLRNSIRSHIITLLQGNGIEMLAFEGKPYESNYPIRAVNADEFADSEKLVVRKTLEPALVKDGHVLHFAKVELARAEDFYQQQEPENVSGN